MTLERIPTVDYTLCERIGHGRHFTVIRAERHSDGTSVALKVLNGLRAPDDPMRAVIARRLAVRRSLAQAGHVEIVAGDALGTQPYLCETLARHTAAEAASHVPVATRMAWVARLFMCVSRMHTLQLTHGNLSAANLMITRNGLQLTGAFSPCLNPLLRHAQDHMQVTAERDVFAACLTAVALLTGDTGFIDAEFGQRTPPARQLRNWAQTHTTDLKTAGVSALLAGLSPKPDARPTAREITQALGQHAQTQPADITTLRLWVADTGQTAAIQGPSGHLGRGGINPTDPSLSRAHALIQRQDGFWSLQPFPGHRVLLNGQPVLTRCVLHPGDWLTVGATRCQVVE
jgi:hypothetical protein